MSVVPKVHKNEVSSVSISSKNEEDSVKVISTSPDGFIKMIDLTDCTIKKAFFACSSGINTAT